MKGNNKMMPPSQKNIQTISTNSLVLSVILVTLRWDITLAILKMRLGNGFNSTIVLLIVSMLPISKLNALGDPSPMMTSTIGRRNRIVKVHICWSIKRWENTTHNWWSNHSNKKCRCYSYWSWKRSRLLRLKKNKRSKLNRKKRAAIWSKIRRRRNRLESKYRSSKLKWSENIRARITLILKEQLYNKTRVGENRMLMATP